MQCDEVRATERKFFSAASEEVSIFAVRARTHFGMIGDFFCPKKPGISSRFMRLLLFRAFSSRRSSNEFGPLLESAFFRRTKTHPDRFPSGPTRRNHDWIPHPGQLRSSLTRCQSPGHEYLHLRAMHAERLRLPLHDGCCSGKKQRKHLNLMKQRRIFRGLRL